MSALLKKKQKNKIVSVDMPKDETIVCKNCGKEINKARVIEKKYVCEKCG